MPLAKPYPPTPVGYPEIRLRKHRRGEARYVRVS